MKNSSWLFIAVLFFISCGEEQKKTEENSEKKTEQSDSGVVDNQNITCTLLSENHSAFPATFTIMGNKSSHVSELELILNSENILEGKFRRDSSEYKFTIDPSALIAKISATSASTEFHQKISVYQFEKQWHFDTVNLSSEINLRLINPASGNFWYAEIFETPKNQARFASFHVSLPPMVYQKLFEKLNPGKDKNLLNFMYSAPELEKVDYNKLRRMGKFYEGFAGTTGNMKLNEDDSEKKTHIRKLNNFKTYQDYFEKEFRASAADENGFDTIQTLANSVKEFYQVNAFIYKTTYSLSSNSKDSLLEIQFDYKDKNGTPTQRLVIGGIPFSTISKLAITDYNQARFIPVGFASFKDAPDLFCLISNMSGYWSDNTYGRNIGGVKLYWDKQSKSKMHIWLIAEDGITPLMHYVSNLDRLFGN